jgi:hypothetical protein
LYDTEAKTPRGGCGQLALDKPPFLKAILDFSSSDWSIQSQLAALNLRDELTTNVVGHQEDETCLGQIGRFVIRHFLRLFGLFWNHLSVANL